jgi:hypothetical protein
MADSELASLRSESGLPDSLNIALPGEIVGVEEPGPRPGCSHLGERVIANALTQLPRASANGALPWSSAFFVTMK